MTGPTQPGARRFLRRQWWAISDRFRCVVCALSWHLPATPEFRATRCDRCGALIEWDDNGGWRYA